MPNSELPLAVFENESSHRANTVAQQAVSVYRELIRKCFEGYSGFLLIDEGSDDDADDSPEWRPFTSDIFAVVGPCITTPNYRTISAFVDLYDKLTLISLGTAPSEIIAQFPGLPDTLLPYSDDSKAPNYILAGPSSPVTPQDPKAALAAHGFVRTNPAAPLPPLQSAPQSSSQDPAWLAAATSNPAASQTTDRIPAWAPGGSPTAPGASPPIVADAAATSADDVANHAGTLTRPWRFTQGIVAATAARAAAIARSAATPPFPLLPCERRLLWRGFRAVYIAGCPIHPLRAVSSRLAVANGHAADVMTKLNASAAEESDADAFVCRLVGPGVTDVVGVRVDYVSFLALCEAGARFSLWGPTKRALARAAHTTAPEFVRLSRLVDEYVRIRGGVKATSATGGVAGLADPAAAALPEPPGGVRLLSKHAADAPPVSAAAAAMIPTLPRADPPAPAGAPYPGGIGGALSTGPVNKYADGHPQAAQSPVPTAAPHAAARAAVADGTYGAALNISGAHPAPVTALARTPGDAPGVASLQPDALTRPVGAADGYSAAAGPTPPLPPSALHAPQSSSLAYPQLAPMAHTAYSTHRQPDPAAVPLTHPDLVGQSAHPAVRQEVSAARLVDMQQRQAYAAAVGGGIDASHASLPLRMPSRSLDPAAFSPTTSSSRGGSVPPRLTAQFGHGPVGHALPTHLPPMPLVQSASAAQAYEIVQPAPLVRSVVAVQQVPTYQPMQPVAYQQPYVQPVMYVYAQAPAPPPPPTSYPQTHLPPMAYAPYPAQQVVYVDQQQLAYQQQPVVYAAQQYQQPQYQQQYGYVQQQQYQYQQQQQQQLQPLQQYHQQQQQQQQQHQGGGTTPSRSPLRSTTVGTPTSGTSLPALSSRFAVTSS